MTFDPATEIQNFLVFGEFGDVNPSICDSSTYTFRSVDRMEEVFEHEIEGCFLYSRHWNPTNKYLSAALARMEGGESSLRGGGEGSEGEGVLFSREVRGERGGGVGERGGSER